MSNEPAQKSADRSASILQRLVSGLAYGVYYPDKTTGAAYVQVKAGAGRFRFGIWFKSPRWRKFLFQRFDDLGLKGAWHLDFLLFSVGKVVDR